MTWNDVRTLLRQYPNIDVGVHTADHVDLTSMTMEIAVAEMSHCVEQFRRELGRQPLHFSFPYSRSNISLRDRLPSLGLTSAMTSAQGINRIGAVDPFNLGRLEAPTSMGLLGHWTSGAYPMLSRQLFGRA
jgi:peptidoglycan/xylan/chitin deacetylase (PgdA/CDA1 family)